MRRSLAGKRILITGASSGIGHAVAQEAARSGMRVFLTGRSTQALDELTAALTRDGHEAAALSADLTSPARRLKLLDAAVARLCGLDVRLDYAGLGTQGRFQESSAEVLRKIMEVNFFASAELIRLALPHLAKGNQPAIVQVASMTGRRSMPFWSEYSASKFAVCGLIESLR